MLLFYSQASPYARKVRMLIQEKGLGEQVKLVPCNPLEKPSELVQANPLGKVPTLVTDDGDAIYDSPVICEYLDSLATQPRLLPGSGMERWHVRRWEALADGIMDAAYNIVMEGRRPAEQKSSEWLQHWDRDIRQALKQADRDLGSMPQIISIAQLGLGSALGYLDLRLADMAWRADSPELAAWYEEFETRPSMVETQPQ